MKLKYIFSRLHCKLVAYIVFYLYHDIVFSILFFLFEA